MTNDRPVGKAAERTNGPEQESGGAPPGYTAAEWRVLGSKRRIYADLSVIEGCEDEKLQGPSRQLFEYFQGGWSTLVTSGEITRALRSAPDAVQAWMRGVPEAHIETVEVSDEAKTLAGAYRAAGAFSPERRDDALHVAVASVAGVDSFATWCGRLAEWPRERAINEVNERLGHPEIKVWDPRPLSAWEPPPKNGFDCIRFVREARARIHEETEDMSSEEFVRWLRSRRPTDPRLAALKARKVPPESTRPPAPRSNP